MWHVTSRSGEASCKLLYSVYWLPSFMGMIQLRLTIVCVENYIY